MTFISLARVWIIIALFGCVFAFVASVSLLHAAVPVIFDSDIGPDVDDVGAMAVLHALADNGELEILGTACGTRNQYGAPCLDAINTYYGRPDIPVGTLKGDAGHKGGSRYNRHLADNFPNDIKNGKNAENAVSMYRRVLKAQPDNSVTIIVVGFKTNLSNLLKSKPDEHSTLNGKDLVKKKVKLCVDMGGRYPRGKEYNFMEDAPSAKHMVDNWPTPIVFSGSEIGTKICTGTCLKSISVQSPIRKAYELYHKVSGKCRASWDLTAVLYAARGAKNYWTAVSTGYCHVFAEGNNEWRSSPDKDHAYLVKKMSETDMRDLLNKLVCQAPGGSSAVSKSGPLSHGRGGGVELQMVFAQSRPVLEYRLKHSAFISITIHDLTGRKVSFQLVGQRIAGKHRIQLDPTRMPAGVYFVDLSMDHGRAKVTKKIAVFQ